MYNPICLSDAWTTPQKTWNGILYLTSVTEQQFYPGSSSNGEIKIEYQHFYDRFFFGEKKEDQLLRATWAFFLHIIHRLYVNPNISETKNNQM